MSISYQKLGKAIALRSNQLRDGVDAAALEADYSAADLDDIMDGADVPYTALKTDIINVEAAIAAMIGISSNTVLRSSLMLEADVDSGEPLRTNVGAKKFYGKFDGVFDADTDMPLKFTDQETVERRITNPGGFFKVKQNIYAFVGTKIIYFCSSGYAVIRGVGWSRAVAEAAFDAEGDSVMHDSLFLLWQNMALGNLAQEKFFMEAAGFYNSLAEKNARDVGLAFNPSAITEAVTTNKETRNA